jgi:choline dehydrogenase-like flavoprotein
MAKFAQTVVIIGSGAGGGTLANELCQKGIKVVVLEAGAMQSPASFINDEWKSFVQLAWLDPRTTSGSWRVAKDFSGLPAWICKTVGGSTTHWAGASLRFQEHEFKARTTYGDVKGASLMDWPLTLAEMAPWYDRAEDKMGVTRTHGIPGLPGNNNFKVMHAGARKLGYKEVHTGRMAINSRPRDDRGRCMQLGFCFQGCKSGAKWSTLYVELPKAEKTGNLDLRPQSHVTRIEHNEAGKVTGVVYFDKDGKEQRQRARGSGGRQLDRDAPPAADVSLGEIQGWPGQFLRSGRSQLHAPHDRLGLRRVQGAGAHVPRHHDGRHH